MRKSQRYEVLVAQDGNRSRVATIPRNSNLYLWLFSVAVVLSLAIPVLAYESPGRPTGFVNDFAGVFSTEQKNSIENKLSNLEKETSVEISVVTVKSLGDEVVETYAVKLFEEWGIGKVKVDNGLLILVALDSREARIEVGYGLEPIVTDSASSVVMRNVMIPAFKGGDYFAGVNGAIDTLIGLIKGDSEIMSYIESNTENTNNGFDFSGIAFIIFILFIQLIPVIIYSKSWWLGGVVGFVLGLLIFYSLSAGVIMAVVGLILDYFLSKKFGGKRPPGTHGGVWFGGMGGGRGGGGFGGFGGGMSGGGGSSGRW